VSATPPPIPVVKRFVTEALPPYVVERQGRATGPLVDVLRAVCEQLKWRCDIQLLPWRRAWAQAETGQVDGIFPLLQTPEREALFLFSSPVIDARYALFSRSGQSYVYDGPASLKGHEVGVYGPSGTSSALTELTRDLPGLVIHTEPDNSTVLRKLGHGRYGEQGLAFINESVALWLLKQERLQGLQMAGSVREFTYGYGLVRARWTPGEVETFDEALQRSCRQGKTATLVRPYMVPASACALANR
jgi:polar amino acid transport system substrate-binding protein